MNLKEMFTPLPVLSEDEINSRLDPDYFKPIDSIPETLDNEVITPDEVYKIRLSTLSVALKKL